MAASASGRTRPGASAIPSFSSASTTAFLLMATTCMALRIAGSGLGARALSLLLLAKQVQGRSGAEPGCLLAIERVPESDRVPAAIGMDDLGRDRLPGGEAREIEE